MAHQLKAGVISCARGAGIALRGQLAGDRCTAQNAAVSLATIAWYGTKDFTPTTSAEDATKEAT